MKKLLGTTAILGALAVTAGSAEAANLQVNVGGFLDFQAGYTSDNVINEDRGAGSATDDANTINFNTDTEVHFTVEGTADNGLEYGAVIELEADVNGNDQFKNGGLNADKAYLFAQGGWGRVELGSNTDAAQALSVNSATFASGTGGVDGDFYRYTPSGNGFPAGTISAALTGFGGIIRPELPLAYFGNGTDVAAGAGVFGAGNTNEDANKVTYYSPRIAGFQAGVSFVPNTDVAGFSQPTGSFGYDDVVAGGLNFTTQWDQFAIKAAATGEYGNNKAGGTGVTGTSQHLKAWNAGGNVSFAGFTVGGSYGDWTDTLGDGRDADYWDAGVGYAFGPWSASASYFQSKTDNIGSDSEDKFQNIVVGADYKLAPGLVPYAEVSFFDYNGNGSGAVNDDSGTAVIVGTQLTF